MRWPFRRRRSRTSAAVPPRVDATPVRPSWTRVSPLTTTVAMWPPTLSPVLRMPELASTRSLLAFPELRHRRRSRRRPAGHVTGLATVVPQTDGVFDAEPEPMEDQGIPELTVAEPLPLREQVEDVVRVERPARVEHVARVRLVAHDRPVESAPVLTRAVDEYVGEPVEPATPYRTFDIARFVDQVTGGTSAPGMDAATALAALAGFSSEVTTPPPLAAPRPAAQEPPPPSGASRPRPTLGQSRRRGVGQRSGQQETVQPQSETEPGPPRPPEPPESPESSESPVPLAHRPIEPEPTIPPMPHMPQVAEPSPVGWAAAEPTVQPTVGPAETSRTSTVADAGSAEQPAVHRTHAKQQPSTRRLGLGEPLSSPPPKAGERRPPSPTRPSTPVTLPAPEPVQRRSIADMLAEPLPLAPKPEPPQAKPLAEPTPPEPQPVIAERRNPSEAPSVPAADASPPDVTSVPPAQTSFLAQESPPEPATTTLPDLVLAPRAPIVYRATLDTLPPPAPIVTTAPADVAVAVRSVVGVDVSDVPVRRGPEVTAAARALKARAFTSDGEVHLPIEAGHLDSPPARALLAHELVHAAQQRVFGAALPPETSAEGQALEQAAVTTERWVRGDPVTTDTVTSTGTPATAALVHRPAPLQTVMVRAAVEQTRKLARQVDRIAEAQAVATSTAEPIQRAPDSGFTPTLAPEPSADGSSVTTTTSTSTVLSSWSLADVIGRESTSDDTRGIDELREAIAGLRQSVDALADRPEPDTPDLDDHTTLDDLATKLFGRIRSRLRRELLVDRERAGRLTDFR